MNDPLCEKVIDELYAKEFDRYTRLAIYEALDECGLAAAGVCIIIQALHYVRNLRERGEYPVVDDSNYDDFMDEMIAHIRSWDITVP